MNYSSSIEIAYRGAVHLPAAELWLDPHRARPFAFVSHAHADHFAPHRRILCSRGTHELIRARYGLRDAEYTVLDFGESYEEKGFRFTLYPAGHISGSAQLMVEDLETEESLIYTGDFKTRPSLTAEPIEIRHADILIMETTYGLSRFRLPPTGETVERLAGFVQMTLDDGEVPVLLGYSLGKAQELIAAVHRHLPKATFQVHPSVEKMNRVVRQMGFDLPECEIFDPKERDPAGQVVVIPPTAHKSRGVRNMKNARSAVATGWALGPGAKFRYRVDEVFPLSDHAGYDDLLEFVEAVDPRVVYTLHGSAGEFAADLRGRGREAWSLIGQNQLELDLGLNTSDTNRGEVTDDSGPVHGELAGLARVASRIGEAAGKNRKKEILAAYLKELNGETLERTCLYLGGRCFPAHGETRSTGTGWALLKRALMRASGVSETMYREVSTSQADGARTTYLLLQGKGRGEPATIAEVGELFRQLADSRAPMEKEELIAAWFTRQHHAESALLVSILLGDLRIGLKDGLIEESIAEAFSCGIDEVRRAQMYSGHLGKTAVLASEDRIGEWTFAPFNPLASMLASPEPDAEAIEERLGQSGDGIWLEDKFDGIRAQLHKAEDRAEWFSRDLRSISREFPELVEAALNLPDDVVLDGEIIAYAEGRKLSFFDLQKRLGKKRVESDLFLGEAIPVTFVAFDILWRNGELLTEKTLCERRKDLDALALPEGFRTVEVRQVEGARSIDREFFAARARKNEGLIAKDPQSLYLPGRRGKAWLKLKKAAATLDVVVVKAQQGHGKRSHVLSDYTFAVRDESSDELKVIGKAYSGLTDEEIEELTEHFQEHTVSVSRRVHTVDPNIVLEVAFDSIQPSKRHNSGLSLRFPRIKAIRRDKTVAEIDTLVHARELAASQ